MDDKKIIIDGVDVNEWTDEEVRYKFEKRSPKAIRQIAFDLYKQLKRKEQEYEELRQYHNKCCEEFEKEKQVSLEKYNQLSTNFYSGYYCNTEHCSLLKAKEQENKKLKEDEKSLLNIIDDLQKEKNKWVEKYNDLGQDFDQLKAENEELKKQLERKEENQTQ